MLDAIRKRTGSIVVKGFMIILALSFAAWGINDYVAGPQDPVVAEVGDSEIRGSQLQTQYSRMLGRLRDASGGQLSAEQARAFGIVEQSLDLLINREMLRQEAHNIGIGIPDRAIRDAILENEAFRNPIGVFDRAVYQAVLNQNRLTEEQYEARLRDDIAFEQFLGTLLSGLTVPGAAVDAIRRYRDEQRIADIAIVSADDVGEAPVPDEGALAAYYAENEVAFMAPEYRRVTSISLSPADLLAEIDVDDATVRDEYEYRIDSYTTPDRRNADRLVFDDRETADAAFERLLAGEDFFAVGGNLGGLAESDMALGTISREDLPNEAIADAVFALDRGRTSQPLESPFGWYIFRINDAFPGGTRSFEEVAEEVRQELKIERAADAVYELSNRIEDERAGGATIEEAARTLGIEVSSLGPVDRNGLAEDGSPVGDLPPIADFLSRAFDAQPDIESDMFESVGNVFYILRVDHVVPPRLRPLDSVRERAIAAWQRNWRAERAQAIADDIAAQLVTGDGLADAAERAPIDIEIVNTGPFRRDGSNLMADMGIGVVDAIFALEAGAATEAIASGAGRFAVAVLSEILPATDGLGTAAGNNLRRQLTESAQRDLAAGLDSALRRKYGVRVNQALVDTIFDPTTAIQ